MKNFKAFIVGICDEMMDGFFSELFVASNVSCKENSCFL
jgi:hypothetical protein